MDIKTKSNSAIFMITVLLAVCGTAIVQIIEAFVGLPAMVLCSAFLLWTAGIAVMVEQRQWVFLIVMCIALCIIITGITWQGNLSL